MARILLATHNLHKAKEYRSLLEGLPWPLTTLAEEGLSTQVEEKGSSYAENAVLKATTYAVLSGLITLADDSGLEVEALHGEPGVLSARYAGEEASNEQRLGYLLSRLSHVPWEQRRASFRCVIAIADAYGQVEICEGSCDGYITYEPKGEHGFGYDPVFYLPDLAATMAELPMSIKNSISHRARAAQKAGETLIRIISQ
ncbi:MAG: RdgB/HAM1 family non-canonical purine NTP pyrophosphatase [Chloroflexi bacterium]|nr:RdgB/HAM1 family non-canonical purine NTP pyrophosphatase [Chloroflexota bacterium]